MKRLLTLMAVVFGLVFVAAAQRPLVTLSHNGELSFFSNLSALQSALDSAQNGDIIYLSEGQFTSNSGDITIQKRVSIIGCGYKSHIIANLTVTMRGNPDSYMDAPLFDGVRMEKLSFEANTTDESKINLQEVEIRKCRIRELVNGGHAGNDFRLDRCLIESADFSGARFNNTYVSNCKIRKMVDGSTGYIQISNCTIESTHTCPRVVMNSIIAGTTATNYGGAMATTGGTSTIYNSLFPSTELVNNNSSFVVDNCYFEDPEGGLLDDDLNCNINLTLKGYLGDDGTIVGADGGEFPFSLTPSVPTVDSDNSSVEYDADANKLKVTITVMEN